MEYDIAYRRRFFGIPLNKEFKPVENGDIVGKAIHLTEQKKIQPVYLKVTSGHVGLISGPGKSEYGSAASNRATAQEINLKPGSSTVITLNLGFTSTELVVKKVH